MAYRFIFPEKKTYDIDAIRATYKTPDGKSYEMPRSGSEDGRSHQPFTILQPMDIVDRLDGVQFERLCARFLHKEGFENIGVTPTTGDQGVDIVAFKDGVKYAIQCKRYNHPLGNKPIQEVFTGKSFYGCHVAVVITNSTFTPKAKELADSIGVRLWDRQSIMAMVKRYDLED